MNQPIERLYNLLPAIYRTAEKGETETLRALLAVVESQLQIVNADIDNLYENWFIETCAEWVVPYIGDLLDAQEIYTDSAQTYGLQERRAYVANILSYRRRKGTAPVIEQLARDLTGWRGRAVEFFKLLATTQNIDCVRTTNGFVNVREVDQIDLLGSPFEQQAGYTAQVGSIQSNQGRYNLANIGLFLWRLQTYPIERGTAFAIDERRYTFNPLGYTNIPLFNQPQPETEITGLAAEINVPAKLRILLLSNELKAREQDLLNGTPIINNGYFGNLNQPALQVFINGQRQPLSLDEIAIATLPDQENSTDWQLPQNINKVVAIDPEQGRLAFLDRTVPSQVEVSYAYGFSGDIGGGPYDRTVPLERGDSQLRILPSAVDVLSWEIEQDKSAIDNPLAQAVEIWNQTVTAWQGYREKTCLALAQLKTSQVRIVPQVDDTLRPAAISGIVSGLTVVANPGDTEIFVSPGKALDGQGRLLIVDEIQQIDLKKQQNPTKPVNLCLVIAYRAAQDERNYEISLLPEVTFESYPPGSFILLKNLVIEAGGIQSVSDTNTRPSFKAGIISGLDVILNPGTSNNQETAKGILYYRANPAMAAVVKAGVAVDSKGRMIILKKNQQVDLKPYQNQTVYLVIGFSGIIKVVLEAEIKNYPQTTYIRLAYLEVPHVKIDKLNSSNRITCPPGVIEGLTVTANIGSCTATIAPGKAIDKQGRYIELNLNHRTYLRRYAGQTVVLGVSYSEQPFLPKWQVQAFSFGAVPDTAIPLASLSLDAKGNIINSPDTKVRVLCRPGIVQGLDVTLVNNATQVEISPGTALDSNNQVIRLKKACRLDLSSYPHQTLMLFISRQLGQGWQNIEIVSPRPRRRRKQLGVVPVEPENADTGVITLRDNHSYIGDANIIIPAEKHLYIMGANGDRPHLRGNLFVRGIIPHETSLAGELTVEGLLVEGKLTVLPGNLKRLHIIHSTLVPDKGGLVVEESVQPTPEPEAETEDWLMAVVMYVLNLVLRIIQLLKKMASRSPQENVEELTRLVKQQIIWVLSALQQWILFWQNPQTEDDNSSSSNQTVDPCNFFYPPATSDSTIDLDNHQLNITIHHSICGPVALSSTIPALNIVDSIIDKGADTDRLAISAIGNDTATDLKTTTVFGNTVVHRLEASDCIFNGKVTAKRRQVGCVRFSYLPENVHTPRRYRCQPDLALAEELNRLPGAIAALAIHPQNGKIFAAIAGDGIFSSSDNGQKWQQVNQAQPNITSLIIYTKSPTEIYYFVGTSEGAVFLSKDAGENWEKINPESTTTAITALVADTTSRLFAGTAGDGIFSFSDTGKGWTAVNTNLSNQQITALTSSTTGKVFAGTSGGGVFRFSSDNSSWKAVNRGLTSRQITTLACDATGGIIAGTEDGLICLSVDNGDTWQKIYTDSLKAAITSLLVDERSLTGTISSQEAQVTGVGTLFNSELQVDKQFTALGQTKTIKEIISDTELIIDSPFSANLPPGTRFSCDRYLLAGTANGRIMRSTNTDNNWQAVYVDDLAQSDIASLVINTNNQQVYAGTTVGSILNFSPQEPRWKIINRNLNNLDVKLIVLERLQPRFTSQVYGEPGYAQLSLTCAPEIQTGAEDRSEMGVFNYLQQPQRAAALQNSLEEYLRFGMELGIFYMT
ncbi:YCF48-related protein [Calothrix sp. NIES-2098]|uniref:YCF48-related protein n=1 Tax=Calothrix sp. NIES-2098 TaxID=1954171 RepID=UPI000B5E4FB0|nr:putative sialidase [Calothrix sp. NIES-2098]